VAVAHATRFSRQKFCPHCGSASVFLPWFTSRRRSSVTCQNCATVLQAVYPVSAYYLLTLASAVISEFVLFPLILLALLRMWGWLALSVGAALLINLLASTLLHARATLRVDDRDPVSRKETFGRWFPK
jgi:hypothetical protein